MINISEMISDPDFVQSFTVTRRLGSWENGNFETNPTIFSLSGVVLPMKTRDVVILPGGDQLTGAIEIYTLQPLFTTKLGPMSGVDGCQSDEVSWQGEAWKIYQVLDYEDYGYFKNIAIRKQGA